MILDPINKVKTNLILLCYYNLFSGVAMNSVGKLTHFSVRRFAISLNKSSRFEEFGKVFEIVSTFELVSSLERAKMTGCDLLWYEKCK